MAARARWRRTQAVAAPEVLDEPLDLWQWQREALDAWSRSGQRGIVTAPTGSGKTRLALAAIARFWTAGARVIVVVPTITLQQQWAREISSGLSLGEHQLGFVGGPQTQLSHEHGIVIAVINSARTGVPALAAGWRNEERPVLMVVDECHWAATESNSSIFDASANATLGLSATPERADDGLAEVLVPRIGPVVYSYALRQGLDDGLLAPLACLNLYFDLDEPSRSQLRPVQQAIDEVEAELIDLEPTIQGLAGLEREAHLRRVARRSGRLQRLSELARRRTEILEDAPARRVLINEIAHSDFVSTHRCLFFHERIVEASRTAIELEKAGVRVSVDSSREPAEHRRRELRAFRTGRTSALVAVRTLDEGVDVPDAKVAVIVAGSSSTRQRLQRIGRVVRRTGESAVVVSLLARGSAEEWSTGAGDEFMVGEQRVVHHRWPAITAAQALAQAHTSTYTPQVR